MFVSKEDKVNARAYAIQALERLKEYEKTQVLHEKQIGKCTIMCKNKEQFEDFEQAINNPKMW